jgi:hypothetical protein
VYDFGLRKREVLVALEQAIRELARGARAAVVSVALVSLSVVATTGSLAAFSELAVALQRLSSDGEAASEIDISKCRACKYVLLRAAMLHDGAAPALRLIEKSSASTIRIRGFNSQHVRARSVRAVCVDQRDLPRGVSWVSREARARWLERADGAGILVGEKLWPRRAETFGSVPVLTTDLGRILVEGRLRNRAELSSSALLNHSVVLPNSRRFAAFCAAGSEVWRISAADSAALRRMVYEVDGELRTWLSLRPTREAPYRFGTADLFSRMVLRLVAKMGKWFQFLPISVALLCASGIFAVNVLEASARVHDFGVMRGVGATQSVIVLQLVCEAIGVAIIGCGFAFLLLSVTGLLVLSGTEGVLSMLLGAGVALTMTLLGVLIPGVNAARSVSISALEGRGVE